MAISISPIRPEPKSHAAGRQRHGNLLLYLTIGGVKRKRGQATEFAKAKRATIFTPSDASASTAHAGVVR
jgi:hypothetical protein